MHLNKLTAEEIGGGIQLMDIGASGELDPKWAPLESMVDLTAFDPNGEECARLNAEQSALQSKNYLPYAIGGEDGERDLVKTKSIYCWSLLEPNHPWLDRFSFADEFSVVGSEKINVRKLDTLEEITSTQFDALKMDTQGVELPILKGGERTMESVFYLETETGFTENYVGETRFHELGAYLEEQDFLMFEINPDHRIKRAGAMAQCWRTRGQPLWCEAIWLRDLIAQHRKGKLPDIDRAKALRILLLCAFDGFFDYGLEMAKFFHEELRLLSAEEVAGLSNEDSWILDGWERKPGYAELSRKYAKVELELRLMKSSLSWRIYNRLMRLAGRR